MAIERLDNSSTGYLSYIYGTPQLVSDRCQVGDIVSFRPLLDKTVEEAGIMEGICGEPDDGERMLRKMAVEHVATLPDKTEDALKVLEYAFELVCDYIERGKRPRPVILRVISAETD